MNKIVCLFILLVLGLGSKAQNIDARSIIDKTKNATQLDASEMVSELKIIDAKGRQRVRKTTTATKSFGDIDKTLVKFLAPADVKGTGMLIFDYDEKDDDLWIYMPALRKTRRIVSSDKSKSFMGSEFSNSDMSLPNLNDFNYKLLGVENFEGKECFKIESTPVNEDIADDNGFSKKISFIDKEKYLTYKVELYDLDDELCKITNISGYEIIDQKNKKYSARMMKVKNIQNNRSSSMEVLKIQLGTQLSENHFTTSFLEK